VYQDQHVPAIDPQAEVWFQQALALDSPDIYYQDRDYPKIYQLYLQAAERNHWKAMLNLNPLVALAVFGAVPEYGPVVFGGLQVLISAEVDVLQLAVKKPDDRVMH
jgi:hypothetical protein